MTTLTWKETLPSDGSAVGRSPEEIRAHIQNTAKGLGEWVYWPGSGGGSEASAGQLKPGASRPFYAAESAISNPGPQHLFLASDTTRLFFFVSAETLLAGSIRYLEHKDDPGVDTLWAFQGGSTPLAYSSATTIVTFTTPFVTYPVVTLTSSISGVNLAAYSVTSTALNITARDVSAPGTSCTVTWEALGKVAQ